MLYINRDGITFMIIANYIGMAAYLIHILIGTESPRWLLLNNRNEEAFKSLNWIAQINQLSFSTVLVFD